MGSIQFLPFKNTAWHAWRIATRQVGLAKYIIAQIRAALPLLPAHYHHPPSGAPGRRDLRVHLVRDRDGLDWGEVGGEICTL